MTLPITTQMSRLQDFIKSGWMPAEGPATLDLQDAYTVIEAQRRRIAELESLALRDELTGLFNRRGLADVITRENERVTRGHSAGATLVMIDLNDFKIINDTHGHEAGDAALRAVGIAILSFIRTTDYAARVGGDEFMLLLTHTKPAEVGARLRKLDALLNGLTFEWKQKQLSVRASVGHTALDGKSSATALVSAADEAMYAIKAKHKKDKIRSQTGAQTSSRVSSSERIMA